jgi:hypothetical protein
MLLSLLFLTVSCVLLFGDVTAVDCRELETAISLFYIAILKVADMCR